MTNEELIDIILITSDKKLPEKIEHNFMNTKNGRSKIIISNKKEINILDSDIREIGIARMDALIEKTKFIEILSTFTSVLVLAYTIMFEADKSSKGNMVLIMLGVLYTAGMLVWLFYKERKDIQKFVFFKNLLILSRESSNRS